MIRLTKGNLEALNARFAQYQHPPSMYIAEYEDLTSKLNEFQIQETKILEIMAINDDDKTVMCPSVPRSPLKKFVRAYLPNKQRTSVGIIPGQTVRDALYKPLIRRKIIPELCIVYLYNTKYYLHFYSIRSI